ncbi:hypothetical protein CRE_28928 [Caenorhabditis remanei]|uniref:ShKT domain-containing protein n=1 Tax=Caenorhabditis remanei TaxID=31234 RepID=E3N587_CAERE|nr:hypothetical protein CRE_28928 [Caenorhabditis remanei]
MLVATLLLFLIPSCLSYCDLDCKRLEDDPSKMVWTERAIYCENLYPDSTCDAQYEGQPNVTAGGSAVRPSFCLGPTDANGVTTENPDTIAYAKRYCAKRCGYCCVTEDHTCNWTIPSGYTAEIQKICKEVTWDKCLNSVEYRPIYAKYCPNYCGFCMFNGCVDAVPSCSKDPAVCRSPAMLTFSSQYCKKTCGYCTACPDTRTDCAEMVRLYDYCNVVSRLQKKKECAKTCNMC